MKERRKYERYNLVDIVRYAPDPYFSDTILKGISQNYSYSGLCFITPHSLDDSQEIVLKSAAMPRTKTAVVRWHKEINNSNHKVGVEFIKAFENDS